MHQSSLPQVRLRSAGLTLAATALAAGVLGLTAATARDLVTAPATDFTGLVVQMCAVAAVVATLWCWCLALDVARTAWSRPGGPGCSVGGRIGPLRAGLLSVCGVAVLTAPVTASAGSHSPEPPLTATALAGLPLPDRATGTGRATPSPRSTETDHVVVAAGDCLWSIAARQLGAHASSADVAAYTQRLHATNRTAIGADPDLVHPGQRLTLPPA